MVKKARTELTAVLRRSLNHLDDYALKINREDENIRFVNRLSKKVLMTHHLERKKPTKPQTK